MTLRTVHKLRSLEPGDVDGVDLPKFTLITGTNGAGKSNLLDAIKSVAIRLDELGEIQSNEIRLFKLGELLTSTEGPAQGAQYKEPWANLKNSIENWKEQSPGRHGPTVTDAQTEQWVVQQIRDNRMLSDYTINKMKSATGKNMIDMNVDDLKEHHPLVSSVRDAFETSLTELFLSYWQRKLQNDTAEYVHSKRGTGTFISEDEFLARYGVAPWDSLNDILKIVGLSYQFGEPPLDVEQINYQVTLADSRGIEITPGDLSSGERVLLTIALGLYTGTRTSSIVTLPRVLLLDEPDASLHPSMVRSLLNVIEQVFVQQHGIQVIMTSHSPSTVALAPTESLFVMTREVPKLRKASADEALKLLTVGISSLSVKVENRRQVFVESEYDQEIFQDLFSLMKTRLTTDHSAEFIAAGKQSTGGGCDMVKRLVKELRAAGVDSVHGIIDMDKRGGSPDHVYYLKDRYSIENLVFDPIILGTFLMREHIASPAEFGLDDGLRSFELSETHADSIIDSLAKRLSFGSSQRLVHYIGDFSCQVPVEFLDMRGHDLEALVVSTYPALNRFKHRLKSEIVKRAAADQPNFIPSGLLHLFTEVTS